MYISLIRLDKSSNDNILIFRYRVLNFLCPQSGHVNLMILKEFLKV